MPVLKQGQIQWCFEAKPEAEDPQEGIGGAHVALRQKLFVCRQHLRLQHRPRQGQLCWCACTQCSRQTESAAAGAIIGLSSPRGCVRLVFVPVTSHVF